MANPNFSVEKDMNLSSVNCETLEVGGDLTVGGAIRRIVVGVVEFPLAELVAGRTLTVAESGTIFVLPLVALLSTINLPSPVGNEGVNYRFVTRVDPVAVANIVIASNAANMLGSCIDTAAGAANSVNAAFGAPFQTVVLAAGGGPADTFDMTVTSTGANWHVVARCLQAGAADPVGFI